MYLYILKPQKPEIPHTLQHYSIEGFKEPSKHSKSCYKGVVIKALKLNHPRFYEDKLALSQNLFLSVRDGVWSRQRDAICYVKPVCYCPFYFVI